MQQTGSGFLLTRRQYDKYGKCCFELWLKGADGIKQLVIEQQQAVCFVALSDLALLRELLTLNKISVQTKVLELTTFNREQTAAIYFVSLKDYQIAKKLAQAQQIELLEQDIKPVDRYLMERFIQGGISFIGTAKPSHPFQLSEVQIKHSDVDVELTHLSIDIECDERGNLYSIGLYSTESSGPAEFCAVIYNLQWCEVVPERTAESGYITWCHNERELLTEFCRVVAQVDPDLLIGWNFVRFDIRVLVAAADRLGVKLTLGRDGSAIVFSDGLREGEQRYPDKVYVAGRVVLDGIEVMKNATYNYSSFSLNNVAGEVLGESKLITQSSGDKLAEIKRQYKFEPNALAAYNLQDCRLVSLIFEREKLFEFLITRTVLTGLELDRVGGSVAAFTNLYLPHVHRKGWIAPNLVAPEDYLHSPGGYVMDSIPGIHKDVLVFDFKSLYPSIIRTFNVDPIGLLQAQDLSEAETIEGFRGARFNRASGTLATILDKLWDAREQAKKDGNKIFSNAIKIIMNSFYGVLGSAGCRFYDTKLASSITMRGHWILNQSKLWFEQRGLEVIYGDTDSIFVSLDGVDFDEHTALDLERELNTWWQTKLKQDFALECKLEMEFETHFSPFFMPTIRGSESGSKKRYAGMKLIDGEKKLIFKGLESVRSDWTELAKQFQTELYSRVFNEQPWKPYVLSVIDELKQGKFDDLLVYKKKLRQPLSKYVKTTPPHVKAARADVDPSKYRRGSTISYVITTQGPQTTETQTFSLDYQHYIDKQLLPIAESILTFLEFDAKSLFNEQLSLL